MHVCVLSMKKCMLMLMGICMWSEILACYATNREAEKLEMRHKKKGGMCGGVVRVLVNACV
jgi:hypothetical protein